MIPRRIALGSVAIVLLASCAPTPRRTAPASTAVGVGAAAAVAAPMCRVGPDDGPLVAERGIGGTGAPGIQIAERGIGGTGIIGVVTGFASICLAGREVELPAGVPIEIGGVASGPRGLRAGQVAAIEATGGSILTARRVVVRYEVSGPIESIDGDRLQVAGQSVLLGRDTWLRTAPALGQWVAVSGLRTGTGTGTGTGTIAATRLDLVSTRTILVRGIVRRIDGQYRIGTLPLQPPPHDVLVPGLPVSVTGVYGDAGLQAASVTPDVLAADPAAYFGNYTSNFILEGYAQPIGGQIPFGTQSFAPAGSRPTGPGRAVAVFQRMAAGGVRLDSVVSAPDAASRSGAALPAGAGRFQQAPTPSRGGGEVGRFAPAPVPNRSFGGGGSGRDGGSSDPGGRGAERPGGAKANGAPPNAAPLDGGGGGGRRR